MDQFTRRIVGFGIQRGIVDGPELCRMFDRPFAGRLCPNISARTMILYIGFHQWEANLRVLEVTKIKSAPYVPLSHPFIERLIGTIRRECLDRTLFWATADLEAKLHDFQDFYNKYRTHAGLEGKPPEPVIDGASSKLDFASYKWKRHCRGLYQTPIAADHPGILPMCVRYTGQ
jgi:putative transposase